MARTLAHFSVARAGEDYLITLEDEEGESLEFSATSDLLDLIADEVEEALESDDEESLLDGDDEEEPAEE